MTDNILRKRYDPARFTIGPPGRRQHVDSFSRNDLAQLLCEALEALEQLESYGADMQSMLQRWRRSELGPNDVLPVEPARTVADVWATQAASGADDDGVADLLPTVYAVEDYQWEEEGQVVRLDRMSKQDLMQATCQCVRTLALAREQLHGMSRLVNDWQDGRLLPASRFEVLGA